ncbi:major capsid protein [Streptobacillus moniliformis]|uniref:major capsid protein n=1 Tax=Streptobacillus moniliformis TaxID=34105 RepID=UPI0007E47BBB|nr:major capsid protein [Streptobacillus moniliformis]
MLGITLKALFLVINQMEKPKTFLYDTFFGDRETTDKQKIIVEYSNGRRLMAPIVSRFVPGQEMPKETFSGKFYEPHKIAPLRTFTADEFAFERIAGQNPFSNSDPETKKAKLIAQTLEEQQTQISRRLENMAASVLYNLEINVEGDSIIDKVQYYDISNTEHHVTIATKWDQANANPLEDIKTALRNISENGGSRPNIIVLDPVASDLLQKNSKFMEQLNTRRYEIATIKPEYVSIDGVIYLGSIPSLGVDLIEYQEYYDYVDNDGLTKTKSIIPEGTVLLAPINNKVKFAAESSIKDGLLEGEFIPRITEDELNDKITLRTISKPILIPRNTKSIKVLKVK